MARRVTIAIATASCLCTAGCIASSYRYVDTHESPDETAQRIADEAHARGLAVTSAGEWTDVRDPKVERGRMGSFRVARLRNGGARVETTGEPDAADEILEALHGPPTLTISPSPAEVGWLPAAQLEYSLSLGVAGMGGQEPTWRAEGTVRAGPRLLRMGGGGDYAEPSTSLTLLGGLGFSGVATEAWFRPELVLALDHQSVAEPIAGRIVPSGRRLVLDLSVAALVGLDQGHHGAEIGLSLREGVWGGVFARVGLVDVDGMQVVWSIGASLGTLPSLYVTVLTVIVGAIAGAVLAGASEGVGDVLGGG